VSEKGIYNEVMWLVEKLRLFERSYQGMKYEACGLTQEEVTKAIFYLHKENLRLREIAGLASLALTETRQDMSRRGRDIPEPWYHLEAALKKAGY
jgi:hypothetical protein